MDGFCFSLVSDLFDLQAVVDGEIKTISLKDYRGEAAFLQTDNLHYAVALHASAFLSVGLL